MNIPFSIDPRPSTGFTNARLATLLFLASETMLLGAMMTAYVFLRASSTDWGMAREWMPGAASALAGVVLMLLTSVVMIAAHRASRQGSHSRASLLLIASSLGAVGFIVAALMGFESVLSGGIRPATSTAAAIWFVLTGLHVVHVAGGLAVNGILLGPWRPGRGPNAGAAWVVRLGAAGLYWNFLAITWAVTVGTWYLWMP